MVSEAVEAGAIGVTFGRNVFQHRTPIKLVEALSAIIKRGVSAEEALEMIGT
jgi:fructose-bisphosphate aldolase/2-amino-3,7-dideoxy-D-threo-hept-6-ulosonate synthase